MQNRLHARLTAMSDAADKTSQKLQKIARLYRGTTSPGERGAAQAAFDRVRRGTPYASISINSFNLQPCGCVTLTCKHWRARCQPKSKTPEEEAIEKARRETLDLIRDALAWDDLGPLYARNIDERFRRSSQLRFSERDLRFLKELAWQLSTCHRAPTDVEAAWLNVIVRQMRAQEAVRQEWAAKRARKQAAMAHARSFLRRQRKHTAK
jgi:hypothetical protein